MSKFLQNTMNVKEERIMHLQLEVKVVKALNEHLNERNRRLEEDNGKHLQIINDQTRLIQEMTVTMLFLYLRFDSLFISTI